MARPPARGIGSLCILRLSLGMSTALMRMASIFTAGVVAKATARASTKENRLAIVRLSMGPGTHFPWGRGRATKPTFFWTLLSVRRA